MTVPLIMAFPYKYVEVYTFARAYVNSYISCVKRVCIWSFSGPYFPTFGLKMVFFGLPLLLKLFHPWKQIINIF